MSFLGRNTEKVGGSRFFTEEATALLYLFKNNHPKTNCSAARNKIEKYVLPLCMQSQRAKDNRYRRMKFLGSLLLLLSAVGHAQVFPVQGNLQIAPPYSPFLTDYTALGTQKLSLMEWLHTIGNLGSSVWETAALPKEYWNKDDSKYDSSTIHLPPTLAGVSDAAVEKVTEYQQLVKLGYDAATKEKVREGLWNAVKSISPDNIKKAFENFYEEKKANYTSSKKHIVRHTAGKDAVTVTFAVWGAVAAITNAVKKTGEVIGEKVAKEAAKDGTKIISQFSASTIDDAVRYAMKKAIHIFDKAEHNLNPLVSKLGGQENTIRAVLNAANGKLPLSGVFKDVMLNIGGYNVYIRGRVIDGIPKLGTIFIK